MVDNIELLHQHLDEHPNDHTARMALADCLRETGSALADGYAALAFMGRDVTLRRRWASSWWRCEGVPPASSPNGRSLPEGCVGTEDQLPEDWWTMLNWTFRQAFNHNTRRQAEDAAALAFTRLPLERQRELLSGPQS